MAAESTLSRGVLSNDFNLPDGSRASLLAKYGYLRCIILPRTEEERGSALGRKRPPRGPENANWPDWRLKMRLRVSAFGHKRTLGQPKKPGAIGF